MRRMYWLMIGLAVILLSWLGCDSTRRIMRTLRSDDEMAREVLYELLRDPRLVAKSTDLFPVDTIERVEVVSDTIVQVDTVPVLTVDTIRVMAYVRYDTILYLPDSSAAAIVVVGDGGVRVDLQRLKDTRVVVKRVVETKTVTKTQVVEKPVYISVPEPEEKRWPPWVVAAKWIAIAVITMSVTSLLYRLVRPGDRPLL